MSADLVAQRTRHREWEAAQERVAVTERQLADHQAAVHHLRQRVADLQDAYTADRAELRSQLVQQRHHLQQRHRLGRPTTRVLKRIETLKRQLGTPAQRFQKRQRRLFEQLHTHQTHALKLNQRLAQRLAIREAIDTETLCRCPLQRRQYPLAEWPPTPHFGGLARRVLVMRLLMSWSNLMIEEKSFDYLLKAAANFIKLPQTRMWLDYDAEVDVLYLHFEEKPGSTHSEMREDGIILDYRDDTLVGLTVLEASHRA